MTDVLIVSKELNCFFAGLVLASRGFRVAIDGRDAAEVEAVAFGDACTLRLASRNELTDATRVAMVAAEGEDLDEGIDRAFAERTPDLLVVIGGGTAGLVDLAKAVERIGFDPARVLVASSFVWGGRDETPIVLNSEKLGVLSAFLAEPAESTAALAAQVVPTARIVDPVSAGLASMNAIVHPVPMVLGATEIDRGVEARFFIDTFGGAVTDVVARLDAERLAVARALGCDLPSFEEMLDTYYANEGIGGADLQEKVNTFRAYQRAIIPHGFQHRYLTHEMAGNLGPMAAIGAAVGVDTSIMRALVTLGSVLAGRDLDARSGDIADAFLELARGR